MPQILNPQAVLDYMARVRQTGRLRRNPFAGLVTLGYGQSDPNAFPTEMNYSERIVFGTTVALSSLPNSGSLQDLNNLIAQQQPAGQPAPATTVEGTFNFTPYPFVATAASSQILNANTKRSVLLLQNQSATITIYVNFGQGAALNQGVQLTPGVGLLFDTKVPSNYVTVVAIAGNAPGIALEGM